MVKLQIAASKGVFNIEEHSINLYRQTSRERVAETY